jgi:hypothetical protein
MSQSHKAKNPQDKAMNPERLTSMRRSDMLHLGKGGPRVDVRADGIKRV